MAVTKKQLANLIPPVKGEIRNPYGAPKKLPELNKLLADILGEEKDGITAAEAILKVLRAKASRGDIRAAEILMDRAYGKARQQTDITVNDARKATADLFPDVLDNAKPTDI